MNAVLATNVRIFRRGKHWTQQHLADTAGVQLRTIQRVEEGSGASLETLGALANAFDVSIDFMQTDFEALQASVQKHDEEMRKTHHMIPVKPVDCSSDLGCLEGAEASHLYCASPDDQVQDLFAALRSYVRDIVDIWDDVDAVSQREWQRELFDQVEAIKELGCVVSVGRGVYQMAAFGKLHPMDTFYLVAWPKGKEHPMIAVPRERAPGSVAAR
jgi:transcriptional regulator with XRE-family HTH domain